MARISIWGGVPNHPTRRQAEAIAAELPEHDLTYSVELDALRPRGLEGIDLLVVAGCRYSRIAEAPWIQYWEDPDAPQLVYESLSTAEIEGLAGFVRQGGSLLCHHIGLGTFDDHDELTELFDGRWVWGRSTHAPEPLPEFLVKIAGPSHPITAGLQPFGTVDELYAEIVLPQRSQVLLTSEQFGKTWPVAWVREYGAGRIVTCTLGHDMRAFESEGYRELLRRIVAWLLER